MVIANVKNMFRKKAQLEYLNNYKMLKNKAAFAVQPLQLKIESERNFENCFNSFEMQDFNNRQLPGLKFYILICFFVPVILFSFYYSKDSCI